MSVTTYRTTYAWSSALELAPHLVRLAEQLPDSEMAGLGARLRSLAADIPGSVATDLAAGTHDALPTLLRTVAILQVVESVYPALDTAAPAAAADALVDRVAGDKFAEQVAATAPVVAPEVDDDAAGALPPMVDTNDAAPDTIIAPTAAAEPTTVSVVAAAPATTISVTTEAPDVHPDSPQ